MPPPPYLLKNLFLKRCIKKYTDVHVNDPEKLSDSIYASFGQLMIN